MIINKPSVFIYTVRPSESIVKEVCAGMEEEGVFYEITEQEDTDVGTLAYRAAEDSMLGCGIGIFEESVVLSMKGLKMGRNIEAYHHPAKEQSRRMGANAARAIKKQSLKM